MQAVHQQWKQPDEWRPDRFQPGGEYDSFPDDVRPYMVSQPRIKGSAHLVQEVCVCGFVQLARAGALA